MGMKLRKVGVRTMAGAMAITPVLAACSSGPTYNEWATTDGAAGRINLDDVQNAFKASKSATDFERRVNEIYEGDGMVFILAKKDGDMLTVEGWEDLDKSFAIEEAKDDLLFSIVEGEDRNEMRGHGANGYYSSGFGGGGFLFGYMLGSAFAPRGYYYGTSPSYARGTLTRQRDSYRTGSRYRSQVSRNTKYFSSNKAASSQYATRLSSSRQGYRSTQRSTGSYKSSGTGVRSSWGSSSRSGGFGRGGSRSGGFRGFGGGQTIIGKLMGTTSGPD